MKLNSDGTIEGTPEELAAYEVAQERLRGMGKQTVPAPLPSPDPWPHVPFDPQIGDPPPSTLLYRIPISANGPCESCRNGGVCGCILSNPGVRC